MALSFYGENGSNFYNKFTKLNLTGEKCIPEAKKLVKQIGTIYGLLSSIAHPSKKILGYYYMENRGTLLIGGGVTDKTQHRVKFNLAILNYLLVIHWSSAELIFNDLLESYVFWEKDGNNMKWSPDLEHKKIYLKSIKMFEEALSAQEKISTSE